MPPVPPLALQLPTHAPDTPPELAQSARAFVPVLVASVLAWFAVGLLAARIEKLAGHTPGEEWEPARDQRARTLAPHIIPDGQIAQVTNLSRACRRAAVSVDVPWRGAEPAARSLTAVAASLAADDARKHRFLEIPKVAGIEKFGPGTVTPGTAARTKPADPDAANGEPGRRVQPAFQQDGAPLVPMPVVSPTTL